MIPTAEERQAEAIEESWRMIHELVTTGKATHKAGGALKPSSGELVRLMERLAQMRPPKRRRVPLPESFTLHQTNQGVEDAPTADGAHD